MPEMTAVVVEAPGPPSALVTRRLPIPEPGRGGVRIKVAFVGLNPVDAMLRRERLAWMPVDYPFVPGAEHTGLVDAVGQDVDEAWLGRRVLSRLSFGGYAEYSVTSTRGLIELDDRMDLRTGCAYRGCSLTAWHALNSVARLQAGESVLIHSAAGAVGIMAAQLARNAGARVVGLAGGEAKARFGETFGVGIVDYRQAGWEQRALERNSGRPFDVILDGNGGAQAARNFDLIAPLGRIVFFGASAGAYPSPAPTEMLINKSFSVGGMSLRQVEALRGPEAERRIVQDLVDGRLRAPISMERPLADVAVLHQELENRQLMGRVVIAVGSDLEA